MSGLIRGNRVNLPGVTIGGGDGIGEEFLGTIGPTGPTGSIGLQGLQGLQGPVGGVGPTGAAGVMGLQGPTGSAGADGSIGPTGPAGASVFGGLYPFPISIRDGMITNSSTYVVTYTMNASTTFTKVSNYFEGPISDSYSVAIYRGDLKNATLVAQTNKTAPTTSYNTKSFTLVSGQSLSFTIGSQISIAYTISGNTTTHPKCTGVSNDSLATFTSTKYTDGFPSAIKDIINQVATTVRICMELS